MKRFGVALSAVFLIAGVFAGPAAGASPAVVFTDQATFTGTTEATPIAWPVNADTALPSKPFGTSLHDYSCTQPTIALAGGAVTVTNPTGNWICFIGAGWNAGLANTNPTPTGPTIVDNGEDDYRVVLTFSEPRYAVGFGLLTNSSASETVTLTYADNTTEVVADGQLGTASNSFEFVGFKSSTPIVKVELDTTGGASQNEGITGIWTSPYPALPTTSSDCTADEVYVSSYGSGATNTPVETVALMAGEEYLITARGTFFAGGNFTYDIQADAEYSQDAYQRALGEPWTDSVRNYGSYGEELLELLVGVGGTPAPVEWGAFNANHTYTIQRTGTGDPASFALQIYDIYAPNNTGGLCVLVNGIPVAVPNGPYLAPVGGSVSFDGSASYDPDGDTLTYAWTADGGSLASANTVSPTFTAGTLPGIYDVTLTVTDEHGVDSDEVFTTVVVYDPVGGFVTGGGWIMSPAGAYAADPTLEGKAAFGFVSRYKKGATIPEGNTEFQFKAGDLNFHSSSYDWLVVTGSDYAMFKGTGTINGEGAYKFMIWAGDDDPDTFRIKIWTEDSGVETVVYDNGSDQAIGGGSIVIHTMK
jgi:hypothetical protein